MERVVIIAAITILILGCANTPHKLEPKSSVEPKVNVEQTNNIEQKDTPVVAPPICSSPQDIKYRVFHSMYTDQPSAEATYTKIIANTTVPQFVQLMTVARKESIDSDTRDRGGDLGYIRIANFDKSFGTAVSHLPLKKLSHPIQSKFGWHLVWVSDALDIKTNQHCR